MKCGHCETVATKKTAMTICPLKETNPDGHTHAVCLSCFNRMTAQAPGELVISDEARAKLQRLNAQLSRAFFGEPKR